MICNQRVLIGRLHARRARGAQPIDEDAVFVTVSRYIAHYAAANAAAVGQAGAAAATAGAPPAA
eukprot:5705942-Prymnesium_polylepis.1